MIEFGNFKLVNVPAERNQYDVLLWTFDFNTYIKLDLDQVEFTNKQNSPLPFDEGRLINKSEILLELVNQKLYKVLPELINQEPVKELVKNRWMWDAKDLMSRSGIYSKILKDMPGFEMGPHLDNQFIIGNVILNLADNPCGTRFHKIKPGLFEKEIYFEGPTKRHKGIFFLNMPGALHSVKNSSNVPRYVLNSYWMINN